MSANEETYITENQGRIIFLLNFSIFFSVLNGSMFNVAVPMIAEQFMLMPSQVAWVVTGFIICFAIGSVTYGKLADIYPVKNLITIGLILFNLGSLLGYLSQWYEMLVLARIIQAAGASAIPALAMIVATRYFPPESRGKVLGISASTVAFGTGIGPVVGGFITSTFHWRYLFFITLFTLLAIYFLRKWLPVEGRKSGTFDLGGALLLGGGLTFVLIWVTQTNVWALTIGILLFFLFFFHIRRVKDPFVKPSLFQNLRYRRGLMTGFVAVSTFFGTMLMIPIMLRDLYALSTFQIGMVMFPGAISAAMMGFIGGRLADRVGSIPIVYGGLVLLGVSYFLLSSLSGGLYWLIACILVFGYVGFSFIQSSLAKTISTTLPREQMGVGMGIYNLVFFGSGAIGSAVVGKLLDYSASISINPFVQPRGEAFMYSNIYSGFILVIAVGVMLFYLAFHTGQKLIKEP